MSDPRLDPDAAASRGPTIAVASGKGGTGKTTVAVLLAAAAGEAGTLVDCDVEEPNAHLFLRPDWTQQVRATVLQPRFDRDRCTLCGACQTACRFNAVLVTEPAPMLFAELCHSCGACVSACRDGAVTEAPVEIGTIRHGRWGGVRFVDGVLDVGQARSAPLIDAVRAAAPPGGWTLIDAPPGTSCATIAAVRGVDYVVLVTEPTPFGLNDLALAVEMTRALGRPCGVVINRCDIGDDRVDRYCAEQEVEVLARLPFDRELAERYSRGELVTALPTAQIEALRTLFATVRRVAAGAAS